jgi:hypothetical protein
MLQPSAQRTNKPVEQEMLPTVRAAPAGQDHETEEKKFQQKEKAKAIPEPSQSFMRPRHC